MNNRRFGRTGWQVSEIGYGMWGMAGWTGSDDRESLASMQRALDLGCNFFDTAWAYGAGHSENLLGRLVHNNPGQRIYTATKIPPKNRQWPSSRSFTLDDVFPPEHIHEYVYRSIENAGIPRFDLVQFHVWEDEWTDDDRWINEIDQLKQEGLLSAIGISINRWEPWNGLKAVRSGLVDAVQVIYNIFDQNPEDELFPACRDHDVAVIARVPFDEGTLTGTLKKGMTWPEGDWRNTYFVPENLNASIDRAEKLRQDLPPDMSMPEAALRFILSNPDVATTIPGMRKLTHVDANIAASDSGPLGSDLLDRLHHHRWDRLPTAWSQ